LNAAARAVALSFLLASPSPPRSVPDHVEEHTLANGMKWLLYEQHDSPTVAAFWTPRGLGERAARDHRISHFFEHMMFKGTRTIGTKDIDEDCAHRGAGEGRDQMRAEMEVMREKLRRGRSTTSRTRRAGRIATRARQAVRRLVQKQRETIIKDQIDQIYTKNGARG